jgi:TRAP-type C4-dicarboxylate transport system substrate-binding protein
MIDPFPFAAVFRALLLFTLAVNSGAQSVLFKLGTLAPKGSPFCDVIDSVAEQWKSATNGSVQLRTYPGGVSGSEPDMVRKMKIGQLDAASLTAMGLSIIDPAFTVLQLPGMFDSWEELNYCRTRLAPLISERLEKQGFIVLSYSDLGGIYFFTKKPVRSVAELKKLKICTFAVDQRSKGLWAKAGFNIVDLDATELLAGLQTGLADGYANVSILSLAMQWFGAARYMVAVKYGYAQGMTVVRKEKWLTLEPAQQERLRQIAQEVTAAAAPKIRSIDQMAIDKMVTFGLRVYQPPEAEIASWLEPVVKIYPQVREELVPADVFDRAISFRDEFRKKK